MNTFFLIVKVIVSIYLLVMAFKLLKNFSIAIEDFMSRKTLLKYTNWEFPHYDFKNQNKDEVFVDCSLFVGIVLWFINMTSIQSKSTVIIFTVYALVMLIFFVPTLLKRGTTRLGEFYEDMRKIEDYSTINSHYMLYRARVEGLVDNIKRLIFVCATSALVMLMFVF